MDTFGKSVRMGLRKGHDDDSGLKELKPGMRVSPSLILYEELGRGGFSRVFRVWHEIHRKFYAIKIFARDASVENAVNEFNTLGRLRHEGIVRYEYADRTVPGGLAFILMELLDGENLRRYTAGDMWLPSSEVRDMAVQVLRALEYMQRLDPPVFHRDVKPGNIVWHQHRTFKLIDFNFASSADDRSFGGTPSYIAPDLITDGNRIEWDPSADTFALGVTMYELLSHQYPWPGVRLPNVHRYPTDIRMYRPELPADVAEFLSKAVATDRNGRFRTAGEMLEALLNADFGLGPASSQGGSGRGTGLSGVEGSAAGAGVSGNGLSPEAKYVEPVCDLVVGGDGSSPQFGLLGRLSANGGGVGLDLWNGNVISIFGVPGSGVGRTVGAVSEMAVQQFSKVSRLPAPVSGVIFHYGRNESEAPPYVSMVRPSGDMSQVARLRAEYGAEPAALSDVILLVPASQVAARRAEYPELHVHPLQFHYSELNLRAWTFLLGAVGGDSVYVREMKRILRENRGRLDIGTLSDAVARSAGFDSARKAFARRRLDFAAEWIDEGNDLVQTPDGSYVPPDHDSEWLSSILRPGRLAVVDLQDEMIEPDEVAGLFGAFLSVYPQIAAGMAHFVVFDEAHRYFGNAALSRDVAETVRDVRAKRVSVVFSSTNPVALPSELIELSSVAIVHRFTSPAWLRHIQKAIAPFSKLTAMDLAALGPDEAYVWSSRATSSAVMTQPLRIRLRPGVCDLYLEAQDNQKESEVSGHKSLIFSIF